jgi:hypothetical protein
VKFRVKDLTAWSDVTAMCSDVLKAVGCGLVERGAGTGSSIVKFGAVGIQEEGVRWEGREPLVVAFTRFIMFVIIRRGGIADREGYNGCRAVFDRADEEMLDVSSELGNAGCYCWAFGCSW